MHAYAFMVCHKPHNWNKMLNLSLVSSYENTEKSVFYVREKTAAHIEILTDSHLKFCFGYGKMQRTNV